MTLLCINIWRKAEEVLSMLEKDSNNGYYKLEKMYKEGTLKEYIDALDAVRVVAKVNQEKDDEEKFIELIDAFKEHLDNAKMIFD